MRYLLILLAFTGLAAAQVCDLTPEQWKLTVNAADSEDLDPYLLLAVFWVESKWCHADPETGMLTTSPVGALGVGQLMPGTAELLGIDPMDERENVYGAAHYLKMQWETFQDWPLALAAYNAGPEAVTQYDGIPPFEETENYVADVLAHREEFKKLDSLALPDDREVVTLEAVRDAAPVTAGGVPSPQTAPGNTVIYALLPTGDQRTPYQGVYLLPQTMNGQTVYVMLEPQSFDKTLGGVNGLPEAGSSTDDEEQFDPGHITFGRADVERGGTGPDDGE